jgi:hypothetical protein
MLAAVGNEMLILKLILKPSRLQLFENRQRHNTWLAGWLAVCSMNIS